MPPPWAQDTNGAQFELIKLLRGPEARIFAVGDPNQVGAGAHVRRTPGKGAGRAQGGAQGENGMLRRIWSLEFYGAHTRVQG